MDHLGFIHEKLDIKILILFLLRRLPEDVEPTSLGDLCRQCDEGIGYFDYSDCLAELVETGHIRENEEGCYTITDKGVRNADAVETSLPYSVRRKALRLLEPVAEAMRRSAMITAQHSVTENGCFVTLAMSDGAGEIIHMTVLCADEDQARRIKMNFKKGAEKYYHQIVTILDK